MSFPGSTGTEVSLFKPQTECSNYLVNSGQTFENPSLLFSRLYKQSRT